MIKVHHMIVDAVGSDDQIADQLGVERDLQVQGVLNRAHRGDGMHRGADTADALGVEPGVARVASGEDGLDAAPHLTARPGIDDLAVPDVAVDAQMSLDPRDWIDADACAGHAEAPLIVVCSG